MAQNLLLQGEYQEAREAALRALDKQPGQPEALILLANTAVALGDLDEGARAHREPAQQRPGPRRISSGPGRAGRSAKRSGACRERIQGRCQLDPKSALAHSALANLYWSRNDLKAAEQAFKSAADLASAASPQQMQYADFKLRTGAVPEAKTILETINAKAPAYLPASVALMKISCAERKQEDCDARTQAVLARDQLNFDGLLQDGIRNIEKGDAAKAVRELGYLSSIYTKNPQVRYQLARAYLLLAAKSTNPVDRRDAVERAETSLNEALKLDPSFGSATILLAEIKIAKGSPVRAVDLLIATG